MVLFDITAQYLANMHNTCQYVYAVILIMYLLRKILMLPHYVALISDEFALWCTKLGVFLRENALTLFEFCVDGALDSKKCG